MQNGNLYPASTRIAYDIKLMRPGCALLQASMGGDTKLVSEHFNTEWWLTAPTDDMKVFPITSEQIPKLIEMTRRAYTDGKRQNSSV